MSMEKKTKKKNFPVTSNHSAMSVVKKRPRGRHRKYSEEMKNYTIRENPKKRAAIVKKYKTLQAFWNLAVEKLLG